MNDTSADSNSSSNHQPGNRGVARFAAAVLAITLPAIGLTGCANIDGGGGTRTCSGNFIAPVHNPSGNIVNGQTVGVPITVRWSANCALANGDVSVFLRRVGTNEYQYCWRKPFIDTAAGAAGTEPVTIYFTGNSTSTGLHYIHCYMTGKLSDGTDLPAYSHGHGTTAHCPNVQARSQDKRKPKKY
jgi:hypothetical protein